MKETIAFVGLGNMGAPMARNLAARGFTVRAYDQRMEAREALAAATDATAVASVAEAADGASVLVTMLPDNDHVKSVVIDEGAEALPARSLVIDMSSISPGVARDVHAGLADRGIAFVDAPVSGGTVGAQGGTLTIMAGGEADAFARAKPVLEGMGTTIVHAGGPGMGRCSSSAIRSSSSAT